ncbi:hypothetical protein [Mycolicibacterium conceptionense]|uniref:Uncharacterized protein n=1 Tax=Mycolicibacterium conceptionense TaxID=451644 RepID=A0A1A1X7B9_9MYCO|nr:hypothetical protein [Mycolicibacterium conceptionense]OBF15025.1 hypothetical protein A5726_22870 [Mycolicibacterium conceptionense]OBF30642.1 hypothetical protein A5720_29815 [Mycolicibacterium conceptionense]OBH94989.1 hypothetical protein A5716_23515 [Mycolicibacterium conceptionense]
MRASISEPDGTTIELHRRHDNVITISRAVAGSRVTLTLEPALAQLLVDHINDLLEGEQHDMDW